MLVITLSFTGVVRHLVAQSNLPHQYFARLFNTAYPSEQCGEYQGRTNVSYMCIGEIMKTTGWTFYDNNTFGLGGHYPYEEMAIDDVATHYVDFNIGRDFFHELYRMHRDALADGATKALDKLFGPLPSSSDETSSSGDDDDDYDDLFHTKDVVIGVLVFVVTALLLTVGALWAKLRARERDTEAEREESKTKTDCDDDGLSLAEGHKSSSS